MSKKQKREELAKTTKKAAPAPEPIPETEPIPMPEPVPETTEPQETERTPEYAIISPEGEVVPTPPPAPKKPNGGHKVPKWFSEFDARFSKKFDEIDERLKKLEDQRQTVQADDATCPVEETLVPEQDETVEEIAKTVNEIMDPESHEGGPDDIPEDVDPTTEEVVHDAPVVTPVTEEVKDETADWVPMRVFRYRDPETGEWAGPLKDVFAAKQAGAGTYEPMWAWVGKTDRVIKRPMTPAEMAEAQL